MLDGSQIKNLANPAGTGKYLNESGDYVIVPNGGTPTLITIEVDFGTEPVTSKTFNIIDANIGLLNKVLTYTNSIPATDRVGNDWEVDMPFMTTVVASGSFNLSFVFQYPVVGNRTIDYQII